MRILAIANAHALAHVSRLLEVAKVLRDRGHVVQFAGHGKYLPVAAREGFDVHALPYISVERVVEAVRSQKLWTLYPEAEIEQYIAAELALMRTLNPDVVLLDNRPTARTAADVAGIRTAAVLNVHMSNYRRIPFLSYRQLMPRLPGTAVADRLENVVERALYDRLVMAGLNAVRRKRKLASRYAYEHEEGDVSLFADTPEFNPAGALPAYAAYVGPITWHNDLPAPACVASLDPGKPTAYFSLGSEGLDELVAQLGALVAEGVQVVVASGADAPLAADARRGLFVEPFVNVDRLLPHCAVVCCHGGNGTLYQALSHGLPCVVVATHAEQQYGGNRIAELGLGASTTLRKVRAHGISVLVDAVRHVLGSPAYTARSRAFSATMAPWAGAAVRAADAIEAMAR